MATIEEIPEYIRDYADVFCEELFKELPPNRIFDCEITFKEGAELPKPARAYPLSPAVDRAMREYIEAELAFGKISPSKSPLAAPCFFVKKSNGSLRMVVDYRKINDITIKDSFPLPLITDLIEHTKGSKWFFKLDLRMGFNNLRVKEPWKTAFATKSGLYEYNVMPFGLSGAPPAFQRFITWPFTHNPELSKEEKELIDKCLRWYVDDVIGHAETQEELIKVLRLVMKIFKQNHLFCKLSKCVFMAEKVDFIGFVIGREGVGMQGTKVKAIRDWKLPNEAETDAKRRKENQKLLGFGSFYQRFINNYSSLVKPLTNLTRKDVPWKWGDEEQAAFQGLKDAICSEPVLAHPDPDKQYFMETDASGVAIGAILSQRQNDGYLHPIAFRSQSFKLAELNYDTFDKELLAIVDSCKEWRLYLEGMKHEIIVLTDH